MMKKIQLQNGFGVENLSEVDEPAPKPGKKQVLVRMQYAALNYLDLAMVEGRLGGDFPGPMVPVCDGAGIIEEVGEGVTDLVPGDRVATVFNPVWQDGPYSAEAASLDRRPGLGQVEGQLTQRKALSEAEVVKIPQGLTTREAVTLPIAGVTAWNALRYGEVQNGDSILLHGTGGVSVIALQIAKALGLEVFLVSGNEDKMTKASQLGADHCILREEEDVWVEAVLDKTGGRGVHLVVETVGGENLNHSLRALRHSGTISVVGFLGGAMAPVDLIPLNLKLARLQGISVGSRSDQLQLMNFLEANKIDPVVDRVFPLSAVRDVFNHLAGGRHFGKVLIDLQTNY